MIARAGFIPLAVLLVLVTAPAAHAGGELAVSADGVHWRDNLTNGLFDPSLRWVPGDDRTESFWVRNRADDRGRMTIAVHAIDPDRLVADGDLLLAARVDGRAWQPLTNRVGDVRLAGLPAGTTARVDVRAQFQAAADNTTQQTAVPLTFGVTLSEAAAADHDAPGGQTTGELPDTGAPVLGRWLGLAAAAIGAGLVLLRRSRTHHQGENDA
jgi:hypothetical protein